MKSSKKQKRCRKNKGPVYTDVKGNGFFERRLISREIVETDEEHQSEETIMRIVMELCPGESQIKEGIDSGLGDYYRMAPTNRTIAKYLQKENLQFNDSNYPTYSRAYRYVFLYREKIILISFHSIPFLLLTQSVCICLCILISSNIVS